MKNFILFLFLAIVFCSCVKVQTQQISDNKSQPVPTISDDKNGGNEIGYSRFTTSDKQYLGCWSSVEAAEVVSYELRFFRLTEKDIQTSTMSNPIVYSEAESNDYKDYFVLRTESKDNNIQQYLSVNIVNNDEINIHEFANKNDIVEGDGINYWNLKRENCEKVLKQLKNK